MRLAYRSAVAYYAIAVNCAAIAILIGKAFQPTLGDGFPFATMITAVLIAGWYGGLGPGLLTSVLGAVLIIALVLDPSKWLGDKGIESEAGLLLYLVVTCGMAVICGSMRRAVNRAEQRTAEVTQALEEKLLVERSLNQTARQLERSDAFHRLITDLTSDFTFRMAFSGGESTVEYLSSGFTTITGYTLEELKGLGGWQGIVFPDDVQIAVRSQQLAASGASDRSEMRLLNRQGHVCWIRYLTQPLRSATGDVVGLVGAAQHVTEQRSLEVERQGLLSELAEKNAFIEAVLGQVPVGILVADAETGCLLTSNQEARRIANTDFPVGVSVRGLASNFEQKVFGSNGSPLFNEQWPLQRALRGEVVHDEKVTFLVDQENQLHLSVNARPITDANGKVIAAVSVFHDESESRRSEQQVLESQRFLRCSLDSLSSHIAVLDEYGTILEVNSAWRRFADENHFAVDSYGVGANYLEPFETQATDCGDGQCIARGIRGVMQGLNDNFEFEYPCHSPNEQRWFLMRVTRFTTPGPTRVVVAHENVTKLREALDLLREADRRKDEFLATLAHELRNPLAPILTAVEILKLPQCDEQNKRKTLDMVERQANQLTRLVDDLLDVSRVMRGKIELRLQPLDLNELVQQALETAGPQLTARQHEVDLQLPDTPLRVFADPVRISQVLGNLITNAAKYTESQGRIQIHLVADSESAIVRIKDNGIGLAKETLQGIFDLFVQVDHASTRAQGGLGIGLTLAKNLIELHGGSIHATSPGLGKGSEFTIGIPLLVCSPENCQSSSENDGTIFASTEAQQACRILVVDDNRDAANSLAILLRSLKHEVTVAHSGEAALTALEQSCLDVVFLDIGMPGMDGYEVARRIRASQQADDVCLAALTGWGQAEDRRRTAQAGFDHHIVKPPELKAVLGVIKDAQLDRRLHR